MHIRVMVQQWVGCSGYIAAAGGSVLTANGKLLGYGKPGYRNTSFLPLVVD